MLFLAGILGSVVNLPIVGIKAELIGPLGPMFIANDTVTLLYYLLHF